MKDIEQEKWIGYSTGKMKHGCQDYKITLYLDKPYLDISVPVACFAECKQKNDIT
ncbi:MAG: hypothetical protein PHF37_01360 [Phycisphaerae bacterium]|nr:hypothetical protein [Phycisphaerae bacterium]